ncbi:uncharacterized protein LOC135481066 [Liolophura sinensis]|uniref:uncharacterized protein LOC135481066 n=1 Tax=Liolophura sinensis TaxID=3198878 RepID=UPI0031589F5B
MLLLVTLAAAFAAASAQIDLRPYNLTASIMFVTNDLNNDNQLTQTEFDHVFEIYDFNKDKIIERHEYVCYITKSNSFMGNLAQSLYDEYDMDHDHRLERHDFDNFFNRMDEDNDDVVSALEFVRFWEVLFASKENFSMHGQKHPQHNDKYCLSHGHAHG